MPEVLVIAMARFNYISWSEEDHNSFEVNEMIAWKNLTNSTAIAGLWDQDWQKALILTFCVFSVVGSLFIIASYALFRDLRSRTRQILVCLSIADLGVALANGVGVLYHHVEIVCQIQVRTGGNLGERCVYVSAYIIIFRMYVRTYTYVCVCACVCGL